MPWDESLDIDVFKELVIYVLTVIKGKAKIHFSADIESMLASYQETVNNL